jgi:Zn-dependent protease
VATEGLLWLCVFLVSVTAHEAAHAAVAYLGGDSTAYRGGQVTLNPIPHMKREPFGMVVMPVIGVLTNGFPIGWASTPFDPAWEQQYPRRAAWMSVAGPIANLVLALLAFALLRAGLAAGVFHPIEGGHGAHIVGADFVWLELGARLLSMLLFLNTILCMLNLIPLPPLDGASAITLLLPDALGLQLRRALRRPGFAIAGMITAWFLFGEFARPVLRAVEQLAVR